MFLRKATNTKNGRTYLSIVEGYWDSKAKMSRTKTVQKLGYLDDLQKDFSDPISHFKEVAQKLNNEKQPKTVTLSFDLDEEIQCGDNVKHLGYAPMLQIYHELRLNDFWNNRSRNLNTEYNLNDIAKLLVFSRILEPSSKKKAFDNKGKYFEKFDFSLNDVYRSLTHFSKHIEACQKRINENIPNRNTDVIYYDVTNYYFEIDQQDELRKKGVSKEHRPDPIIQMGLFMDSDGIPISYKLFPGKTNDCETLRPAMADIKRDCGFGRVVSLPTKA